MQHSLRRTREKLRIMMETPHMSWILADMMELVCQDLIAENAELSPQYKTQLVERLKNRYEKIIKEQENIPPKQGHLGI